MSYEVMLCRVYVIVLRCHHLSVQIQEESNKAAMRYDKANSQHAASKEMIRMAESQLGSRVKTEEDAVDPSSPSPLDLAWQEMLNHATLKVKAEIVAQ